MRKWRSGAECFAITLTVAALSLVSAAGLSETRQQHVHDMSHAVMPFSMSKVVHVFRMTETGGVEQVRIRDAQDSDQIGLIRQHLKHEAQRFRHGDYGDPAQLHGADMPGMKELEAAAARIDIEYADLPDGGQITFTSHDLHGLTAIHRWFGAQLSEHGADARAE